MKMEAIWKLKKTANLVRL